MENNIEEVHKQGEYYNELQLTIAAGLGGPIAAGILFFKNFNLLGRRKDALFSILVTIVFCILFIVFLLKIPETSLSKIPTFVTTALYAIPAAICYRIFLKKDIEDLKANNYERKSNWSVVGFSLLGGLLFLMFAGGIGFMQPPYPGDKINIGETNNEIYYNGAVITKSEIELLASSLFNVGYFDKESSTSAHIAKNENVYTITFGVPRTLWDDPGINSEITFMRVNLGFSLKADVVIILEDFDLTGKTYTRKF